jgi:carbonic anhydrase/acetyltransferase-like protein (isoleucine patch superfamily)
MLYKLGNRTPELRGDKHFIAETAAVIGDVVLENNTSIWYSAVLRGDIEPIHIGENSNVQDGAVLHTEKGAPTLIGKNVTIGHLAAVHGCQIGDGSLVGIQATILNKVVIGKNCLIGAHALVTEGKVIPDNSLVVGAPGKVLRSLTEEEIAAMHDNAARYVKNLGDYLEGLETLNVRGNGTTG